MTIIYRVREQAVIAFFLSILKDMCTNNFLKSEICFCTSGMFTSLCTRLFAECVSLRGFLVKYRFCFRAAKAALAFSFFSSAVFEVFAYGSE